MTVRRWVWRCLVGAVFCAGLSACIPGTDSRLEEQKEPHFLAGQNLSRQRDYQGAIDAFEKALEANRRSASAHFELGWLYEEKTEDAAAAIYHYQRFLKLCSRSDGRIDQARDHIRHCTMELAKSVSSLVTLPPSAQSYLEKLLQENKDLKDKLAQWEAYYAAHPQLVASNLPMQNPATNSVAMGQRSEGARPANVRTNDIAAADSTNRQPAAATAKTHTIKAKDTLQTIAKQYGVTLSALKAANPRAEERNLRIGATLTIPTL